MDCILKNSCSHFHLCCHDCDEENCPDRCYDCLDNCKWKINRMSNEPMIVKAIRNEPKQETVECPDDLIYQIELYRKTLGISMTEWLKTIEMTYSGYSRIVNKVGKVKPATLEKLKSIKSIFENAEEEKNV